MNVQQLKQQRGFTIIEVILVLAIAALIFLMVFIALPALQSGQRDTARKQDVGTLAADVTSFVSNNNGAYPAGSATPGTAWAGYGSKLSSNTTTVNVITGAGTTTLAANTAYVALSAQCAVGGATGATGTATQKLAAGSANQYAVFTWVESNGGTGFCQNN